MKGALIQLKNVAEGGGGESRTMIERNIHPKHLNKLIIVGKGGICKCFHSSCTVRRLDCGAY